MKKILILISLIIISLSSYKSFNEEIVIPDEAIRFRVVAKSNDEKDQEIKLKVKDNLQKKLNDLLKNSSSIEETRKLLKANQNEFSLIVKNTLLVNKDDDMYKVKYGLNYFPEKKYKGIIYKEGYYESLVVTLGQGNGKNWWCVLFPPLCLLEADENNTEDVEYQFFVKKIIDKFSK